MSKEPHSRDNLADFAGFAVPQDNWFPVPNDWFDRWIALRQFAGKRRILAPLLVMLYLLKHALWKWRKGHPFHLTRNQLSKGIRRQGQQIDFGTGLTLKSIRSALVTLTSAGWIVEHVDRADKARERHLFAPRLIEDAQFDVDDLASVADGFPELRNNYFQVPNILTDVFSRAQTRSEVLIQSILYLIRHSWGWQDNQARWLTAGEIANGRQYADGSRYDHGIGYGEQEIRDALNRAAEGIELAAPEEGLSILIAQLVEFRDDQDDDLRTRRRYALRMRGTDALKNLAPSQPDQPNSSDEPHTELGGNNESSHVLQNPPADPPVSNRSNSATQHSTPLTRQSIPLTGDCNPLTGQSITPNGHHGPLGGQGVNDPTRLSNPLTEHSVTQAGDCNPLNGPSHSPARINPPRSDSNTLDNTYKEHVEETPSPTPAHRDEPGGDPIWLAVLLEADRALGENPSADLLAMLGVRNPAREKLSHLEPPLILAAALDVWNQSGLHDPVGVLVGRLRDPDTAASYHAGLLAKLPVGDFVTTYRAANYPHRLGLITPKLRSLAGEWARHSGCGRKPELPLPVQILVDRHNDHDELDHVSLPELTPAELPAKPPPSPYQAFWDTVLQQLEWRIFSPTFKNLFTGTEVVEIRDGELVVYAVSTPFAEIMNYRFGALVAEVASAVSDEPINQVRFTHHQPVDDEQPSEDSGDVGFNLGFQEPGVKTSHAYQPSTVSIGRCRSAGIAQRQHSPTGVAI